MVSGVYIGKKDFGDYDLVSTGDYINPISPVFKLKDSGTTIEKIHTLYLIFNDIKVEFAKVKVLGQMTTIRVYLSWDKTNWYNEIETGEVNAIDTVIKKRFYIKFNVDDILLYYNLKTMSNIKNFKLGLYYN